MYPDFMKNALLQLPYWIILHTFKCIEKSSLVGTTRVSKLISKKCGVLCPKAQSVGSTSGHSHLAHHVCKPSPISDRPTGLFRLEI